PLRHRTQSQNHPALEIVFLISFLEQLERPLLAVVSTPPPERRGRFPIPTHHRVPACGVLEAHAKVIGSGFQLSELGVQEAPLRAGGGRLRPLGFNFLDGLWPPSEPKAPRADDRQALTSASGVGN